MRARSLKPSIFKNELLGSADLAITVLFQGLWCTADRDGRLEDRPMRLRAEVFPYRNDINVDAHLTWLHENGFIVRYVAKGLNLIQIVKFAEHQKPHTKETASVLPTLEDADRPKARPKHNLGSGKASPNHNLGSVEHALTPDSLFSDSGLLTADCLVLPSEAMSDAKPPDDVRTVFEHWRKVWNHPKTALDAKRTATIKRALKGYSAADLCTSISGYLNSTHHTGQNDRNAVYDGLNVFLRDSDHIDAGLRFARDPPVLSSKLQQHNVAVLHEWRPPEIRNAPQGLSEVSEDHGDAERDVRQRTLSGTH